MKILSTITLLLLIGAQVYTSEALSEWNCGHKYLEHITTLSPFRDYYCFQPPNQPLESLEGTDDILKVTNPLKNPVLQCEKAANGRGFTSFALFNGKCHAIPVVEPTWPKSWFCVAYGFFFIKCKKTHTMPCTLNGLTCYCGLSSGGTDYLVKYSSQQVHNVGLWIEAEDVFNNTLAMFDSTSENYKVLYKNSKDLVYNAIKEHKICGVATDINVFYSPTMEVRPSKNLGKISLRLDVKTTFMNVPKIHELLQGLPMIISTQQLTFPNIYANVRFLTITSLYGTTKSTATPYNRMLETILTFTVTVLNGKIDPEIYYSIDLAKISESDRTLSNTNLCNGSAYSVSVLTPSCTIKSFSLLPGYYLAIMTAQSKSSNYTFDSKYGFIYMFKAPLVAAIINEGPTCLYTPGQRLWLNASDSFDRDLYETAEEAPAGDLNYTWACSLSTDNFKITSKNVKSLPVVQNGDSTGRSGGCYGNGVGRLYPRTRTIVFQSSSIKPGKSIHFKLFVTKDTRITKYTHKCKVVPSPSEYALRCKFNCGALMKTTARLGLEPFCADPSGCGANVKRFWSIWIFRGIRVDVGYGPIEKIYEKVSSYKALTESSNLYFVLGEYSLEQNQTYKVIHSVQNTKKGEFIIEYVFKTNVLPYGGKCEGDKDTLKAAVDGVKIICSDWRDYEDDFFRYEAWVQVRENDEPLLVYFGTFSTFELKLPLGDIERNFTLKVIVKVFDAYESTDTVLNFIVNSPTFQNPGTDLLKLLDYKHEEDYQKRAQIGYASLSLTAYGGTGNISLSEKTSIRSEIISSMIGAPTNGSQNIKLSSLLLVETTSNIEELSFEGQEKSISATIELSRSLSLVNDTDDPAEFDKTGSSLLHLSGNILDGASQIEADDSNNAQETNKNINSSQINNVAKTAVNATETVSSMLLSKMLGGEKSKKFNTPYIGLEITKTENNKFQKDYNINGGGIVSSSDLDTLLESSTKCPINMTCSAAEAFVSSKALFNKNNPYIWGNGTRKIQSSVVSLEYSTSYGETIALRDVENEFILKIPVKQHKPLTYDSEFPNFITPDTDCVQHKFFIDKNDTTFELIITLALEKYTTVYVRYEKRASKKKYDEMYYHPDLSSCVEPAPRDNCTGIHDFMECMDLPFQESLVKITYNETFNNSNNATLNETQSYNVSTQVNCERANVTIPNVGFLANSSGHPRNLSVCLDYHKVVTCPPCPVFKNNSKNGTGNSYYMEYYQFLKNISKGRPDCWNGTNQTIVTIYDQYGNATNITRPVVCPKAQLFLDCKNRSVEKYQKCKSLLSKKNLIYSRYEKCYKNIYRRFFGLDKFNKSGWYYVSMCYNSTQSPQPTSPSPTRTPVPTKNILGNETSGRNSRRRRDSERSKLSFNSRGMFGYQDIDYEVNVASGEQSDATEDKESGESFFFLEKTSDSNKVVRRTRRSTTQRKCAKVEEKDPPTTPPPPTELPPVRRQIFNVSSSLNYSFDINLFTCVFWNETMEIWSTEGCRPHKNSSASEIVCLCNHLTSFGSDILVAPNPIDFDLVLAGFANLGESGNFAVLFTVISMFLVYGLIIVAVRYADKQDRLLVSKARIGTIDSSGNILNYEVVVSTGTFRGSETTAKVTMVIHGENGCSPIIPIVDETGCSAGILTRGSVVYVMVNSPNDLGEIHYIRIWHNNEGNGPAWFLRQITVRNISTNKQWLFIHNDWFAVDKGDGNIDRRLYVASEEDKRHFKTLFYSHTAKSFSEKHLWVSVVLRPPSSSFTRVQRVSCCFSLLLTAMLANAMFYQNGNTDSNTIQIGPINMSVKQIIIGIESGLVVAPINLLIMTLFRKARPKSADQPEANQNSETHTKSQKDSAKKKGFPYWVIYVAYVLCALSVLVSSVVVIFYSMMWGTEKSNAWMASVVLSLIQDILLVQPLKVLVLSLLLSLIFRKPPEEDESQKPDDGSNNTEENDVIDMEMTSHPETSYEPLENEEVLKAQIYQVRKNKVRWALKEMLLHLVFTVMLGFIVLGSQSPHRYYIAKHLYDIFPDSEGVTDTNQFWSWCEDVFLPNLYQNKWYNGQNFTDELEGFISTKKAALIGMPRFRQARVESENCDATKYYYKMQEMFPTCYPHYTLSKADESSPISKSSSNPSKKNVQLNDSVLSGAIGFERMCLQPFMVQTAQKLGTLPLVTDIGTTYSGNGMVADLGYDYDTASEVVLNLKADRWISRQTRVVFVEFVVFEPTSTLFALVRFAFEHRPTGAIISSKRVEPFALYGVGHSSFKTVMDLMELVFLVFNIILIIRLIIKGIKEKYLFFKDVWNFHMLLMLSLSLTTMGLNFTRELYTTRMIKAIQENPYSRMSFDYVQYGTDVFNALASVVIFLATLKLLKLFSFNMKIQTFSLVLRISKPFLVTYGVLFIILFLAFAQAGNLIFGQVIPRYSTVLSSFVNVFQMAFGKGLFFHDLKDISGSLGPLFIFCYFMTITILMVNFFVAILNDSYVDGCEMVSSETNEDAILSAFMTTYLKTSLEDISNSLKKVISSRKNSISRKISTNHQIEKDKNEALTQKENEAEYFLY